MITIEQFKGLLQKNTDDFRQQSFLVAVSGGSDSMVLASLFSKIGASFQVAHVNYHLREENSNLDQKLVEEFCKINNIKVHVYEVSEKDEKPEGSIQLWARELRYRFFHKIMDQENLTALATAHHLNDQLETFLINLSRGSGIKGLSGMPNNKQIVRPLLHFTKEEIYAFAEENNIPFREDASNQKNDYLRNKIRNTITPSLLEINSKFLNQFDQSIRLLKETKNFAFEQAEKIFHEISTRNDNEIIINKIELQKESLFVQYYILEKFGFKNTDENQKIFSAQTGSQFQSKDFSLTINRDEIIISPSNQHQNKFKDEEIILLKDESIQNKDLIIDLKDFIEVENQGKEWHFELGKITFPIKLRHKKEGDIFQPLGMSGKKKVSKFFKDEKISILAKEKIWLLVDGKDSILGILPYRQDGRWTLNNDSKNKLTIKF